MKIIHIAHAPEAYGISTFLLGLIQFQKEKFKYQDLAMAFHTEKGRIEKYSAIGIPIYCLGKSSARDLRIFYNFYRISKKYDIIDFHTHSPLAFLAALCAKKKIVFTFHGALGLKNNWLDLMTKLYYRVIIHRYSDRITFASLASLKRYISKIGGGLQKGKISIFPYGRMLKDIMPSKSKIEVRRQLGINNSFIVGTAARMDKAKKIERLIEAMALLDESKNIILVLAGDGDKNYEDYLKKLAITLNVWGRVCFLGYREDIADIINSFDFFTLPSRNEPFGLALLEAMALGIPCAVFEDGGGAVDIIRGGGFIVNAPEELAQRILEIKESDKLRAEMSRKAKERAAKFDIKFAAEHFDSIYHELMRE